MYNSGPAPEAGTDRPDMSGYLDGPAEKDYKSNKNIGSGRAFLERYFSS